MKFLRDFQIEMNRLESKLYKDEIERNSLIELFYSSPIWCQILLVSKVELTKAERLRLKAKALTDPTSSLRLLIKNQEELTEEENHIAWKLILETPETCKIIIKDHKKFYLSLSQNERQQVLEQAFMTCDSMFWILYSLPLNDKMQVLRNMKDAIEQNHPSKKEILESVRLFLDKLDKYSAGLERTLAFNIVLYDAETSLSAVKDSILRPDEIKQVYKKHHQTYFAEFKDDKNIVSLLNYMNFFGSLIINEEQHIIATKLMKKKHKHNVETILYHHNFDEDVADRLKAFVLANKLIDN